jgi:F-type H+-transporting ATPase subunit gamma
MALNTKTINRRIKSVVNTRKITKAMELVAASKMRKAVAAVLGTRPYSTMAWSMVSNLRRRPENGSHPLLESRKEVRRILAILVTSDRGLCGGFNAQIIRAAAEFVLARPDGSVDFVAVGKRGEAWVKRRKLPLVASFHGILSALTSVSIRPLARLANDGFLGGRWDEIHLVYTDFVSAIVQKPRTKTLLPLRQDADLGQASLHGVAGEQGSASHAATEFLFEPSPGAVLDGLLPRIAESQVYQALLESNASEHSARMMAMRSASDAASEMIDDLKFTFNQARQASITREIAEIAAGAAAISG